MNTTVQLVPLECSDREQFISDNQESFNYDADLYHNILWECIL